MVLHAFSGRTQFLPTSSKTGRNFAHMKFGSITVDPEDVLMIVDNSVTGDSTVVLLNGQVLIVDAVSAVLLSLYLTDGTLPPSDGN